METRLIEVIIKGKVWYYCLVRKFLYFDPKGIGGTFSLNVLTPEEKEDLERQVNALCSEGELKTEAG